MNFGGPPHGDGNRVIGAGAHHNVTGDVNITLHLPRAAPASGGSDGGPSRDGVLGRLALQSRRRLIERWAAAGLDDALAADLADDPEVGRGPLALPAIAAQGLLVLEGDFGSGKSVTLERLHQQDLAVACQDADAPVPVYLDAKSVHGPLSEAVTSSARPVGEVHLFGVRLVLDGLDDVPVARACELIGQARALVSGRAGSRAVAAARPGLPDLRPCDRVPYPPLNAEEADVLAQRIIGTPNWVPSDSEALREAMRLPLFVIIAALSRQEGGQVPSSRIDFLDNLVARALRRPGADQHSTRTLLAKLARLTIEAQGPAPAGEAGSEAEIGALNATRLVVQRDRTIAFGLPVLEEYFGGKAVMELGLPARVLDSPGELERWRYPLALALAAAGWERSATLLEPILSRHPGITAWLLHEGIPRDGRGSLSGVPSAERCGERIHRALTALMPALAPAVGLLRISGPQGAPPLVLGVRTSGEELLTLARHTPTADGTTGVTAVPESLDWEGLKAFTGPDGSLTSGWPAVDYAAWPWRWSMDWITGELAAFLKRRDLHAHLPGPAAVERRWAVCRAITSQNSRFCEHISAADILTGLRRHTDLPNLMAAHLAPGLRATGLELRCLLQELGAGTGVEPDGAVYCPYPVPDLPAGTSRWFLGHYSDQRLAELASHIHSNALAIYRDTCERWLPGLIPTLGLACILPVQIVGEVYRDQQDDPAGFPAHLCSFDTLPLPAGQASTATFTYRAESPAGNQWDSIRRRRDEISSAIQRLHPRSAPWARPRFVHGVFNAPSDTPATDLAYRWLWEDLQALRILTGPPPR